MAIVNLYRAIDMLHPLAWTGSVTIANGSQVQIFDGINKQNYYGIFYYASNSLSGGTVTSSDYFYNTSLYYSISGSNIPALTAYSYINNGDAAGLLNYALSGQDTVNGSSYGDYIIGASGSDILYGNAGNDVLAGGDGNDNLKGGAGNDVILGGAGSDTVVFDGIYNQYTVVPEAAGWVLVFGPDGIDAVRETEVLQFSDRNINTSSFSPTNIIGGIYAIAYSSLNMLTGGVWFGAYTYSDSSLLNLDDGIRNQAMFGNFTYNASGTLTGGTIQAIGGAIGGVPNYTVTGMNLDFTSYNTYISRNDVQGLYAAVLSGNDKLVGSGAGDVLYSFDGNDTADGGAGNDDLFGGVGNDSLIGGDGNDRLFAWTGNDSLNGGAGDDELYGDAGSDAMDGGDGVDFAGYSAPRSQFTLSRDNANVVSIRDTVSGDVDTLVNVEGAGFSDGTYVPLIPGVTGNWFYGTPFNDTITATGSGAALFGDLGSDTLTGTSGRDYFHKTASDGSDTLYGGGDKDFAGYQVASTGYSIAQVSSNTYRVTAPNGDVDTLIDLEAIGFTDKYVGLIPQTFVNSDGSTWVQGTYLADTLAGSGASDGLRGGDGNDSLSGLGGNDYLEGEAGSDTLNGGDGHDYAWYGRTRSQFTLSQQPDGSVTVRDNSNLSDVDTLISTEAVGFGDQPVVVVMQQRWDNASGGAWFDGSIFADTLNGTAFADGFGGGEGNDTIDGGLGNDYMLGGTGADTFVFTTTSGFDRIGDFSFSQGDRIKLSAGMSWGAGPDTIAADTWLSFGPNAGVALTGVNYTQVNSSWFV